MKKTTIFFYIILFMLSVGCDISNDQKAIACDSTQVNKSEPIKDDFAYVGTQNNTSETAKDDYNMQEILFFETETFDASWDDMEFPVDMGAVIQDNETFPIHSQSEAIEIGKTLLRKNQDIGKMKNYNLVSITHAINDNLWKLNYSESQDIWTDSAVLSIVIEGSTGNIMAAWAEE